MTDGSIPAPPPDDSVAATPPSVLSYTFGPFRIDVLARHLLRNDAVIPLQAKLFETLLFLVRHHGEPVHKDELMRTIWPNSFVSDDSLVQNISALRRTLGDDASQPQYILTLARRGYRFIGAVQEHTEGTPPSLAGPQEPGKVEPRPSAPPASASALAKTMPPAYRWTALALALTLVGAAAVLLRIGGPAQGRGALETPMRFFEGLPEGQVLLGGAVLSPDSRNIAFTARNGAGETRLWVRALNSGAAHPLMGTEGAIDVFWSPDSQHLAFFSGGQLKRIDQTSSSPLVLASTQRSHPPGGSWGPRNLLLYADQGKIFSIQASGGTPTVVAEPDRARQPSEFRWPQVLPDGQHFLFFVNNEGTDGSGTYLGTIGTRATTRLVDGARATYAPPNHLLFVRGGALMAQRFDPALGLQGSPVTVAGGFSESATLSATAAGVLAISEPTARGRLLWLDRRGKEFGTVDLPKSLYSIALSPNNKQVLASNMEDANWTVWLIDLDRNVSTEIAKNASFPVWAPDGVRFAFSSMRSGEGDIFVKSIAGQPNELAWLKTNDLKVVSDWSADGRFIIYANKLHQTLWVLPTFGDRMPYEFLQTRDHLRSGKVSPNGHWMAYVSDETGSNDVYVESFPAPGAKRRISMAGGTQPVWRADGRELFYLSNDHQVMAVTIQTADGAPGIPLPLFRVPDLTRLFTVTNDGQRFLVVAPEPINDKASIVVMTHWEAAQTP